MAVERFSIVLDNVSGVFFAGQAVTGKVIVSITEKWEKFSGKFDNTIFFSLKKNIVRLYH